jgi:hypothetical protein
MKAILAAAIAAVAVASLAAAADARPHRVCVHHHHHTVCHRVRR